MLKKNLIQRKLANLKEYLSELEALSGRSLEEYVKDFEYRRAVERLIQIIVECAIDGNNLIITGMGKRPAMEYKESFSKLVDMGIISSDFASRLIPYTSLRNRIVHEYAEIKNELVYTSIKMLLRDFKMYLAEMVKFLQKEKEAE